MYGGLQPDKDNNLDIIYGHFFARGAHYPVMNKRMAERRLEPLAIPINSLATSEVGLLNKTKNKPGYLFVRIISYL